MNSKPFFTVGVPVYNTSRWLDDTIKTIISQDFTDFELIFCNDGSTDNSLDILSKYAEQDNRIKIINRPNGGVSSARNAIISHACGEYIYFIDSDDLMCEKALSTAASVLKQNNYPDVLETSYFMQDGEGKNKFKYTAAYPGDKYFDTSLTNDERATLMWLDSTYSVCVFAKFIRTEFLHKSGVVFPLQYTMGEDNDFVFQLHRNTGRIAYADFCPNIYINPREGSIVSQMSVRSFYSSVKYTASLLDDVKLYNISDKFWEENRSKYEHKVSDFYSERINYCLNLLHSNVAKDILWSKVDIVDNFLNKYRHSITDKNLLFSIIRFLGIKNTFKILYKYLRFKGVISDE